MYIGKMILERIDYKNKKHLLFLKELMSSSNMNYLWDISDEKLLINKNNSRFIVLNNKREQVGYINISNETEAYFGKTVSIYYAITEKKRRQHYAVKMLDQLSEYLFSVRDIDCIVAQVDINNVASQKVLLRSGYDKLYESSEDLKFVKLKQNAS